MSTAILYVITHSSTSLSIYGMYSGPDYSPSDQTSLNIANAVFDHLV